MLLHPQISSALIPLLLIYSTRTVGMLHRLWGRIMAQTATRRSSSQRRGFSPKLVDVGFVLSGASLGNVLTIYPVSIIPQMFYAH
jgi:hypothetical protein